MEITADDLRLVRGSQGLTQAELATILKVSHRTIANWEATGVPESKLQRVNLMIGSGLRVARQQASDAEGLTVKTSPSKAGPTATAVAPLDLDGASAKRRAHLLRAFTDVDLLNELADRAKTRGVALPRGK